MDNTQAAKRLKDIAATISGAPSEPIIVLRMTTEGAKQMAADLEAIAEAVGTPAAPAPEAPAAA